MLQHEIEEAQRLVKTDAYQMSIGEIVNMYKDNELVINPDFQRLFRWEPRQKSKLIESILLGIPLPPIFVYERNDGVWELIDGLQRMSTILEFMGVLRAPGMQSTKPPSFLGETKYLPSLNNTVWEKTSAIDGLSVDDQVELDKEHHLAIRRARLGVEILKRPSDSQTKYDLFQRLNAGGTRANPQELRNCIMIMVSEPFFKMVKELGDHGSYRAVLAASPDQIIRQHHMEWASRFLVHSDLPYDRKLDVGDFIDEGVIKLAENGNLPEMAKHFKDTFDLLNSAVGSNALRRHLGGNPVGRVSLAAFECIAVGIGANLDAIKLQSDAGQFVRDRVEKFWEDPALESFFTPGLRGTVRIQRTIPFGKNFFAP